MYHNPKLKPQENYQASCPPCWVLPKHIHATLKSDTNFFDKQKVADRDLLRYNGVYYNWNLLHTERKILLEVATLCPSKLQRLKTTDLLP